MTREHAWDAPLRAGGRGRLRPAPARPGLVAVLLIAVTVASACGRKGNPLPPFVRIPAAVDQITATRLGSEVYVTVTVPITNIDTSIPVDIARIDVYGYTGRTAPLRTRWAELGDVVATIPVAPSSPDQTAPRPGAPAITPGGEAVPGASVTIRDILTADELAQGRVPAVDARRQPAAASTVVEAAVAGALRRFYIAIPFSRRGRPGPPGTQTELPLIALPDAPARPVALYTTDAVSISWEPAGGLLGFLLDRPLAPEPLPFAEPDVVGPPVAATVIAPDLPPGPTSYNVYRELAPDPLELPPPGGAAPWSASLPVTLHPTPLAATLLTDPIEFGRPRCYTVRALRGTPPAQVISDPSPPTCLTPIDVFPPAAPTGLAAVPSQGGISLIWEPNAEIDLGGYLVLRRQAGDATLRLLTAAPLPDARFRDTTVAPGMRYIYSVIAVDNQLPLPNISAESDPVEETAR